jgi:hypothetical protein
VIAALLLLVQAGAGDTLHVRRVDSIPDAADSARIGPPAAVIRTGQGLASVWLFRLRDTVQLFAAIPDTTYYWGDDFVISLDVGGERGAAPGHDDFQWYFRRMLDSSVIYRGRNGRWEAPRADPDWRLGPERSGGGWTVTSGSSPTGWWVRLRLDREWLEGGEKGRPAIAFRIYDDAPAGWYAWPEARVGAQATSVERTPSAWVPLAPP